MMVVMVWSGCDRHVIATIGLSGPRTESVV